MTGSDSARGIAKRVETGLNWSPKVESPVSFYDDDGNLILAGDLECLQS